ncbi:MAG: ATP-binding protein, partial [Bacteroidota bacterium]|nr:ATP-binding protein [Bacteroidota bacterium]
IEWYCREFSERTSIPCVLSLEEIDPVSKQINLALYRVFQESMTNVIRHAKATNVSVKLISFPDIVLTICDDGIGITSEKIESGKSFGILGMHQRINQCGGIIEISGTPGKGTKIQVSIPNPNAPENEEHE